MRRNFRDATNKIEIDMKEVKEKLTTLTASAEKSAQEGQLVERATHRKKVMKSDTFFEYMTQLLCMMTVIAGCRPTQHTLVLYWSKGTPWPPLTLVIHEDTL